MMTTTPDQPILEVRGLRAGYKPVTVVHDLSLHVPRGGLVAVLGPNGAGKSTMLNAIAGVLKPMSGEVVFEGQRIDGWAAHRVARSGVSLVPQGFQVLGRLTVAENLELGAYTAKRAERGERLAGVYERFPRLHERRKTLASSLSGGERAMLAVSRALMSEPKLLLLDEPSAGLAPLAVARLFEAIAEVRERGVTTLVVEQNVRQALRIADHAYVVNAGQVVFSGAPAALAEAGVLEQAYLGGEGSVAV
jgi:branched-chain amino acid transport system ATP-binding protein